MATEAGGGVTFDIFTFVIVLVALISHFLQPLSFLIHMASVRLLEEFAAVSEIELER